MMRNMIIALIIGLLFGLGILALDKWRERP